MSIHISAQTFYVLTFAPRIMSTTTISATEIKAPSLCDVCKQVQDLDRLIDHEDPITHHRSWTALCQSAEDGCKLCGAFLEAEGIRRHPSETLARDFDKDMNWPETQITIMPQGRNGLFILEQRALFRHPFKDVVSIWFELYTNSGE